MSSGTEGSRADGLSECGGRWRNRVRVHRRRCLDLDPVAEAAGDARSTHELPQAHRSGNHRAGVGLASGEFHPLPLHRSQVGLVVVWAAVVGLVTPSSSRWRLSAGDARDWDSLTGFLPAEHGTGPGLRDPHVLREPSGWPRRAARRRCRTRSAWSLRFFIAIGLLLVIGLILTPYRGLRLRWSARKCSRSPQCSCCSSSLRCSPSAPRPGRPVPRSPRTRAHPRCRAGFRRPAGGRLCRCGRRPEPRAVQLDPRQGLRHGHLRAAAGQPDHRAAGGRTEHGLRLRAHRREQRRAGAGGGGSPTTSSSARSS